MEIFLIGLVVFILLTLWKGIVMVPQGFEFTIERFRKYTHTQGPGIGLILPYVNNIGRKINMMEQVLDVPRQEVITRDNAVVAVDGVVFFQVLNAAKAAYEITNLEIAALNLVMTNIRTVLGSMDLDESLSKRDEINARLLRVVDEATHPWGIKVNRIEIKDITPPRDLVESMARQMKAEREKRAQILEAEGARQAEILRAEGEKQAAVLEAEGRREAAFRDAEARERLAEAEAKATLMVSQAISKGDVQAINYFIADKYVGALKALASSPNQKTLLMPLETMGVLGSLAGIAEVTRQSFETRVSRKRRRKCRNPDHAQDRLFLVDHRFCTAGRRNPDSGRCPALVRHRCAGARCSADCRADHGCRAAGHVVRHFLGDHGRHLLEVLPQRRAEK
ncbi:MAG: SPFH/Band 7/PHB domain protein [Ahniella sp.]|nr:SPFH/Band 7/PHB domain protein [Ahniella sp.]